MHRRPMRIPLIQRSKLDTPNRVHFLGFQVMGAQVLLNEIAAPLGTVTHPYSPSLDKYAAAMIG